ncbi:hypothetical protein TNCV_1820111 [Trichonephila clavipes]|nr:hypothetical protein TNCV_1820111 [Trichonephila clavipes]
MLIQDKTAFIRRFLGLTAIYACLLAFRMLRPPSQRLIDQFQRGLKDVFALSYLDVHHRPRRNILTKHLDDLKKFLKDYL